MSAAGPAVVDCIDNKILSNVEVMEQLIAAAKKFGRRVVSIPGALTGVLALDLPPPAVALRISGRKPTPPDAATALPLRRASQGRRRRRLPTALTAGGLSPSGTACP